MSSHPKVLALAPTALGVGYAVLQGSCLLDCGVWGLRSGRDAVAKVASLSRLLGSVLQREQPEHLLVERPGVRSRTPLQNAIRAEIAHLGEETGKGVRTRTLTTARRVVVGPGHLATPSAVARILARLCPAKLEPLLPAEDIATPAFGRARYWAPLWRALTLAAAETFLSHKS